MKNSIHVFSIPDEELQEWADCFDVDTQDDDWQEQVTAILVFCHQNHQNIF